MQTTKRFIGSMLLAGAVAILGSTTGCAVAVACGGGEVDCGGFCADLSVDPNNCGACGASCLIGDSCFDGACLTTACIPDGSGPCGGDGDCCSLFCASDGNCGCMPSGTGFCSGDSDCCNNFCDLNTGICQ